MNTLGVDAAGVDAAGVRDAGVVTVGPDVPDRVERDTDLRLMVPALLAWGALAVLVGQTTTVRTVVLGVSGLTVAVTGGRAAARSIRSRREEAARIPRRREPGGRSGGSEDGGVDGKHGSGSFVALSAAAVLLAVSALTGWTAVREAGPLRELAAQRAVVQVTGTVAIDPRVVGGASGNRAGGRPVVVLTLDVQEVTGRGSTAGVRSPVLLLGPPELLTLRWHEQVALAGRLGPTDDPADDVVALLDARGPVTVVSRPGPVDRAAEVVRARFAAATAALPPDARGLLPGLVIGDTSRTPADLTAALQTTGMTHLSAVSGSNVSFVLGAALWLCGWLGVGRRWRPLVALLLLLGFVVLVRPEPSVVRAAAMGCVGLLGLGVSRRREGVPALAAAVLVLLVWDPWLARSFGFVLSTLATLGLLLLVAPWGAAIARRLPERLAGLGPALAVPLAAQVVCGPVIVLLQGSVSVVGVATNLLAGPLVAPATVVGVVVAALSVGSPTAAAWLAWLPALPTLGIAWIARAGARVPWGSVPWSSAAGGAVALTVLSLAVVGCGPWMVHHARRRPVVACAAGVLGLAGAVPTTSVAWPPDGWRLVMCDVGQGDGLVVRSVEGAVVVVDTGPDPALVDGCLTRLGVEDVDAVVLTHDHADHVDGLPGVLAGRRVGRVLTTPLDAPPTQAADIARETGAAGVPLAPLYAGDDLSWPGITAHVWWPARVIHAGSEPNNASVVLGVEVDGVRLLLLGDVEREAGHEVLTRLRGDPAELGRGFDVVKVAHHGSANRVDDLYAEVRAPLALVSVGEGNDYGHPAPSTLSLLDREGFTVMRTDRDGDVAVGGTAGHVAVVTRG